MIEIGAQNSVEKKNGLRLAIFGATGGTGLEVTRQALERGHSVRVLVRNPNRMPLVNQNMRIVMGNVLDAESVRKTLLGADAVINCLGQNSIFRNTGVVSQGTRQILAVMKEMGLRRIVITSSFGVGESRVQASLWQRVVFSTLLRAPYAGNIGEDEAFFAVIGRDWPQGILPYAERFDVKPPGLFLLYALVAQAFGSGVAAIKGLEISFVAVSAYGLWRIGRDHFSRPVGMAAATLYPLYSLAMSGVNAPVALFLNGFEIFAEMRLQGRDRVEAEEAFLGIVQ